MNIPKVLLPLLFSMAFILTVSAQKGIQTDTLQVEGVCEMCKKRIEKAAFIKGVRLAEWDKTTQKLVVIYRARKTDLDKVATAVAQAGHDTDRKKASDEAYSELPDCCAYRDGVEVH